MTKFSNISLSLGDGGYGRVREGMSDSRFYECGEIFISSAVASLKHMMTV
jgi:hypothetical protein